MKYAKKAVNMLLHANNYYLQGQHAVHDYFNPVDFNGQYDFTKHPNYKKPESGRRLFSKKQSKMLNTPSRNYTMSAVRSRSRAQSLGKRAASSGSSGISKRRIVFKNPVRTPNRGMRPRRKYVSRTTGVNRGFFKKPYKKNLNIFDKMTKLGHVARSESGSVFTATHCAYVGHGTFPVAAVIQSAAYAIVKSMTSKSGFQIPSWNSGLPEGLRLYIEFQLNDQTGASGSTDQIFTTADTYQTMADWIYAWFLATYGTNSTDIQYLLSRFYLYAYNGSANTIMHCAIRAPEIRVHFAVESVMKIQNRTATGTNIEADDVDNIPLIGKVFEASGNGLRTVTKYPSATDGLIIDKTKGYICFDDAPLSGFPFREPPLDSTFVQSVKSSGVKLGPGAIKSSKLITKSSILLQDLLQQTGFLLNKGAVDAYVKRGKVRVYSLEKLMNVTTDLIRIGYEHQLNVGSYLTHTKVTTLPTYNTEIV